MEHKLYKSAEEKKLAGVCGGLADYFKVDVTLVRLIWLLVSLVAGVVPGVLAYIAAMLIIPDEPGYYYNEMTAVTVVRP